jgi:hypothetical protein
MFHLQALLLAWVVRSRNHAAGILTEPLLISNLCTSKNPHKKKCGPAVDIWVGIITIAALELGRD